MHVDDNALTAFVAGELPAVEQSRIREHLDDCEDCRAVVRVAVERSNIPPSRADTLAPFTRAVALSEQGGGDPVNTASIRAGLARALYASGKDKRRGAAMGRAARAVLLEAGETSAVADIDSWLH